MRTLFCTERSDVGTHTWHAESLQAEDAQLGPLLRSFRSASVSEPVDGGSPLALEQAIASPLSQSLRWDGLLQMYIYQPYDMDAILEFDRRITHRYSEFCASVGQYYGGTWLCPQFGRQWLIEVAAFDVPTSQEAHELGADVTLPDDVRLIVEECRSLQNRNAPRYIVWLTPRAERVAGGRHGGRHEDYAARA